MNARIRLESLDTSPYEELIDHLPLRWTHANLPASSERHGAPISYGNYRRLIGILLLTTQSTHQTQTLFTAVINQAMALGKPSRWVEQELKWEGMLAGADRIDFLRLELQQAARMDDDTLDTYNERVNRFQLKS